MRVTYLGQAGLLVEVGGKRILTDPWLTEGAYSGTWFHTHILSEAGITPASICRDIDYVFISHEHEDHLDPATLAHLPAETPFIICQFKTPRVRHQLESLGFRQITEVPPGQTIQLADKVTATVLGTAEYTNDAAILIEGDGCRVLNETDCKLSYGDLERIGERGVDIGFYMFSGANWYPMMYDYTPDAMKERIRKRRRSLLKGLVQRVKVTRPRLVVPAAGPCMVLHPELLSLNGEEAGIFIDPEEAISIVRAANLGCEPVNMAAGDVWDSCTGIESRAPEAFRVPRMEYIQRTAAELLPQLRLAEATEKPAGPDLGRYLAEYFNTAVGAQTASMRQFINAKVAVDVTGAQGGQWTIDFTGTGPDYVREGIAPDWTYRMQTDDKVLYPFVTGEKPFFEHLFLSLRVRLSRRPDVYNEPLYHFFYEPDAQKLESWYAVSVA